MANKQPVFDFVPHCYPSTTKNLIQPDPTQASVPPWVSPPGFMADLSQLSWTGTHLLGFDKGWFHGTDWEVLKVSPPPLNSTIESFLYSASGAHKQGDNGVKGQSTAEYHKRSKPNIGLSTTCLISHPASLQCPVTGSEDTCGIRATGLKCIFSSQRTAFQYIIPINTVSLIPLIILTREEDFSFVGITGNIIPGSCPNRTVNNTLGGGNPDNRIRWFLWKYLRHQYEV